MKNLVLVYIIIWSLFSCQSKKEMLELAKSIETNVPAGAISSLETDQDLDKLLTEIGTSRYVLLGEASHGTAEFYTWRAKITQRLIREKGFNVIAVEGDWPDMYKLNQYIKGSAAHGTSATEVLQTLDRWPTWMWANQEVADLGEWLRAHNQTQLTGKPVSFYGLDVYSLWDSMEAVLAYLEETDPAGAVAARKAYDCFAPYQKDEYAYAQATVKENKSCADELTQVLKTIQAKVNAAPARDEAAFNVLQNALIAVNAERYYNAMVRSNTDSWNIRDRHMVQTIDNIMKQHGPEAKIIVWEHNTHVGDARATDMADQGTVNVGQLVREQYGSEGVYVVGFGTYQGSVIAARSWEGTPQEMKVPAGITGSWEALLHQVAPVNKLVITKYLQENKELLKRIGHRAIGVVYHPESESGNYVPTVLPQRYDAFLFIDQTQALHPLPKGKSGKKAPAPALVTTPEDSGL